MKIWISEHVVSQIEDWSRSAHPAEIGGILAGVMAEGRPWITCAAVLPSGEPADTHYEIPKDSTPFVIDGFRLLDGRIGYLGDWHSHPKDMGLSPRDFSTLRKLSANHAVGPLPLILVIRRRRGGYVLDGRCFARGRVRKVNFVLAGRLPQETVGPSVKRSLIRSLIRR